MYFILTLLFVLSIIFGWISLTDKGKYIIDKIKNELSKLITKKDTKD